MTGSDRRGVIRIIITMIIITITMITMILMTIITIITIIITIIYVIVLLIITISNNDMCHRARTEEVHGRKPPGPGSPPPPTPQGGKRGGLLVEGDEVRRVGLRPPAWGMRNPAHRDLPRALCVLKAPMAWGSEGCAVRRDVGIDDHR